jgi:hypothetical protein
MRTLCITALFVSIVVGCYAADSSGHHAGLLFTGRIGAEPVSVKEINGPGLRQNTYLVVAKANGFVIEYGFAGHWKNCVIALHSVTIREPGKPPQTFDDISSLPSFERAERDCTEYLKKIRIICDKEMDDKFRKAYERAIQPKSD